MSHLLGQFLSSSGRYFDRLIADLEKATGGQALDASLIGQLMTGTNLKIRQLGLTPGDTLAEEMYQALINKFNFDNQVLHYQILGENLEPNFVNFQISQQVTELLDQEVLALTDQAMLKVLSSLPPNKLLKELQVATLEELLLDYQLVEIFDLAWRLSSKKWQQSALEILASFSKRTWSWRHLNCVNINRQLSQLYYSQCPERHFQASILTGIVLFRPFKATELSKIKLLKILLEALEQAQAIVDANNQLQLASCADLSVDCLSDALAKQSGQVWSLCGSPVPWRSIGRALASSVNTKQRLPTEIAKCHLVDFKPLDRLSKHYDLSYWVDGQYLAFKNQADIVSLNLADVAANASTSKSSQRLGQRSYFEDSLWDELIRRYLGHDYLLGQIKMQLKSSQKGGK